MHAREWKGLRTRHAEDLRRERVLYCQPTGPNPLYHRDDLVERPWNPLFQVALHLPSEQDKDAMHAREWKGLRTRHAEELRTLQVASLCVCERERESERVCVCERESVCEREREFAHSRLRA